MAGQPLCNVPQHHGTAVNMLFNAAPRGCSKLLACVHASCGAPQLFFGVLWVHKPTCDAVISVDPAPGIWCMSCVTIHLAWACLCAYAL
jgi:hypothetical protein